MTIKNIKKKMKNQRINTVGQRVKMTDDTVAINSGIFSHCFKTIQSTFVSVKWKNVRMYVACCIMHRITLVQKNAKDFITGGTGKYNLGLGEQHIKN